MQNKAKEIITKIIMTPTILGSSIFYGVLNTIAFIKEMYESKEEK